MTRTPDEQAIRDLIATWIAATKAGDVDRVLAVVTDDVVFLTPGNPPMRKAAFADTQRAMADADFDATSTVEEVHVTGEWAWARTSLSIVVTPRAGGRTMRRSGSTLSIFCKRGGAWALHRDANMLGAAP